MYQGAWSTERWGGAPAMLPDSATEYPPARWLLPPEKEFVPQNMLKTYFEKMYRWIHITFTYQCDYLFLIYKCKLIQKAFDNNHSCCKGQFSQYKASLIEK